MPKYRVEYGPQTEEHLRALGAGGASLVLDGVLRQLSHQPTVETRNRKRMRPNPLAPWELRIGRFRVYYDVLSELRPTVLIRAIGVKDRKRVTIGGETLEL